MQYLGYFVATIGYNNVPLVKSNKFQLKSCTQKMTRLLAEVIYIFCCYHYFFLFTPTLYIGRNVYFTLKPQLDPTPGLLLLSVHHVLLIPFFYFIVIYSCHVCYFNFCSL